MEILTNTPVNPQFSIKPRRRLVPTMGTDGEVDEIAMQEIVQVISKFMPSERATATITDWCGSCIGDDASTRCLRSMKIVAFQCAGRTVDIRAWVKQMARHMQTTGAHISIFPETIICGVDKHTGGEHVPRTWHPCH